MLSFLRGSISDTASAGEAQLARASPCHGGGRGFESRLSRHYFNGLFTSRFDCDKAGNPVHREWSCIPASAVAPAASDRLARIDQDDAGGACPYRKVRLAVSRINETGRKVCSEAQPC